MFTRKYTAEELHKEIESGYKNDKQVLVQVQVGILYQLERIADVLDSIKLKV
jgi:hypothetical protein